MKRAELAHRSLRCLVGLVLARRRGPLEPIFYGELSKRIGRHPNPSFGLGMGRVLGVMGHMLQDVEKKWGEPIPHIQSLAVLARGEFKGLPDKGLDEFWPEYSKMNATQKLRRVRIEYERITAFGRRWNKVLSEFGIPEVVREPGACGRGYGGGESPEHKRLKEHIRDNPDLVGAGSDWKATPEYPLPTLDEIDVLFQSENACIAVEVKSRVSDASRDDYERGIYQVVKYQAILEAMHRAGDPEGRPSTTAFLVVQTALRARERALAQCLGVSVIEGVKPPPAGRRG